MIDLDVLEQIAQGAMENGEYESVLGPQMLALVRVARAAEDFAFDDPYDTIETEFPGALNELRAALAPFRTPVPA